MFLNINPNLKNCVLECKVLGLPEYFILEMYILGLKEDIQGEVMRNKPKDIHEAFDLSLLVESQQTERRGGGYKTFSNKTTKFSQFTPKSDH